MKNISKNLDEIVKLWIRNNIPNYEQCESHIYVGELNKYSSESSTVSIHEPLAGHGFKDSIWIFEYDQNIYLGIDNMLGKKFKTFCQKHIRI